MGRVWLVSADNATDLVSREADAATYFSDGADFLWQATGRPLFDTLDTPIEQTERIANNMDRKLA